MSTNMSSPEEARKNFRDILSEDTSPMPPTDLPPGWTAVYSVRILGSCQIRMPPILAR